MDIASIIITALICIEESEHSKLNILRQSLKKELCVIKSHI